MNYFKNEMKRLGQAFPVKSWIEHVFRFVGHTVFVATTYSCHDSMKAATDNLRIRGHDCVVVFQLNFIITQTDSMLDLFSLWAVVYHLLF